MKVVQGVIGVGEVVVGAMTGNVGLIIMGAVTLGSLLFPSTADQPKPAVPDTQLPTSSYGVPRNVSYGRNLVTGNLVLYTNRQTHEVKQDSGGKGGSEPVVIGYTISASFAWDLGYGPAPRECLAVYAGDNLVDSAKYIILDGTDTTPHPHVEDVLTADGKTRFPVWKNRLVILFPDYDLGTSAYMPLFKFEIRCGGDDDMAPSDITEDILTNKLYAEGLDSDFIDADANAATKTYCTDNDLLISRTFNQQISILDALRDVIDHHNGYISAMDGLIAHKQLKAEDPSFSLVKGDFICEKGKLPIQVSVAGHRDYSNKLILEWTKRSQRYRNGTCQASSAVDIRDNGLKLATERLPGLMTYDRASKMCNLRWRRSIWNPEGYAFSVGPKSMDLKPGDVGSLTNVETRLSGQLSRIVSMSENKDYVTAASAIAEHAEMHALQVTGSDTSDSPTVGTLTGEAETVLGLQAIELPAFLGDPAQVIVAAPFTAPAQTDWAGAVAYIAEASGGPYSQVPESKIYGGSITGVIHALGGTDTIDVTLDGDAELSSFETQDDMLADITGKNVMAVQITGGTVFLKYQTATLLSGKTWRLTNFLYDLMGYAQLNDYGAIAVAGKVVIFDGGSMNIPLADSWIGKTAYIKVASFNHKGEAEDISALTAVSVAVTGLCYKPLPPDPYCFNDWVENEGAALVTGATVNIPFGAFFVTWVSRQRTTPNVFYLPAGGISDWIGAMDTDFVRWRFEVYNGSTLLRAWNVFNLPRIFSYTTDDQTADGASAITPLTLKVYQENSRGTSEPAVITINRS